MSYITKKSAEIVLKEEPNLPEKLRRRKEKLKELSCSRPDISSWLMDFPYPQLKEILSAPQEHFEKRHGNRTSEKTFSLSERKKFIEEIKGHIKICKHCALKNEHDAAFFTEVSTAIKRHKKVVEEPVDPIPVQMPALTTQA